MREAKGEEVGRSDWEEACGGTWRKVARDVRWHVAYGGLASACIPYMLATLLATLVTLDGAPTRGVAASVRWWLRRSAR